MLSCSDSRKEITSVLIATLVKESEIIINSSSAQSVLIGTSLGSSMSNLNLDNLMDIPKIRLYRALNVIYYTMPQENHLYLINCYFKNFLDA